MFPRGLSESPAPVYVLGDLIIDEYIDCVTHGMCDAIAAPILKHLGRGTSYAGGAGLVASQLSQLGVHTSFVTRLDGAQHTNAVVEWLTTIGVNVLSLPGVTTYQQTKKQRFVAVDLQPPRVVQRVDMDTRADAYITYSEQQRMLRLLVEEIPSNAVLVLADYGKGCLHGQWYAQLLECFKEAGKPVPKIVANMHRSRCWASHYVVTANTKETIAQYNSINPDGCHDPVLMAEFIRKHCGITHYVLTRGSDGLNILSDDGVVVVPSYDTPALDSTGAGDIVTAIIAYAVASDYPVAKIASLAHEFAAMSTRIIGTGPINWCMVTDTHWFAEQPAASRVYAADDVQAIAAWREQLESTCSVGFTNGCFDLLHAGHVQFLLQANKQCDILIVGVNTDDTVRALKGSMRPVQPCAVRCLGVATIADMVIPFSDATPHNLLRALRPSVLFKGHGYNTPESAIGSEIVTEYGGEVVLIPGDLEMCATTNTIESIRTQSCQ